MAVTPNSFIDYVATANQTVFPVVIARISNEHIRVFQNGAVLTLTTDYVISNTSVTLVVPASTDDLIRIQRDTPQAARVVDFLAGANIVEQDLDNSALQMLYLSQEVWDQVLQLRDQPVIVVDWNTGALPIITPEPDYSEDAASRRTPSRGTILGSGQPWITVDGPNKEVDLAPGKYRIDVNMIIRDPGSTGSLLSSAISNDQDGGGNVRLHVVVPGLTVKNPEFITATYLTNLTARTSLTFRMAVTAAGGALDVMSPCQWTVTRLGGDPELN